MRLLEPDINQALIAGGEKTAVIYCTATTDGTLTLIKYTVN
jgi:hypothetical protein